MVYARDFLEFEGDVTVVLNGTNSSILKPNTDLVDNEVAVIHSLESGTIINGFFKVEGGKSDDITSKHLNGGEINATLKYDPENDDLIILPH